MKRILSTILILGLMLIPISVKAENNVITIPSEVVFPDGAKIQFKNTCANPVIVRSADEKQTISTVVAYGNNGTIYQGGTYKLVCSDNTPPLNLDNAVNAFAVYSPDTKTFYLDFISDLDPESGIDIQKSTIKVNGKPINFVIENHLINVGNVAPTAIEYNLVNGRSLSTGTQSFTFSGWSGIKLSPLILKLGESVTSTTYKQQYQLPKIYRDTNKNLVLEAPTSLTVKDLLSGRITNSDNSVTIGMTKDQYSVGSNKITFFYDKFPDKMRMSNNLILLSDSAGNSINYRLVPNSLYNFVGEFGIQYLSDKITIKTKGVGLPLDKIGLDYYYFDLTKNGTRVAYSQTINPEQPIMFDDVERTFTLDLSQLKSGEYSLNFKYKPIGTERLFIIEVADVYVSTPKQSTSTKAYSITVDKDTTTVKINPGATISGIKINGVQAITTNNSVASLSFNTMQIPNWAYDTIEPIVTNYTPPAPPTPPTPTVPVTPTPTVPITPPAPATSTTIILQIGSKNMYVNGKLVVLDSAPIIRNDRTLLPIRFVAEALGAQVGWDDSTKKVTIQDSSTKIEMWINKPTAIVNGKAVYIDPANHNVVPVIVNARTMLPVRFVAESLGAQVEWDEALQKITVKT